MKIHFPASFLWGSSISSYQLEGDNCFSDWFLWEKKKRLEPAGASTDHYRRFREDFSLANSLGHNALRLSLEWSRIVPQKGIFSDEQLKHYIDVVEDLRIKKIEPVITLHHFTNPAWFVQEGGWLKPLSIDYFLEYVRRVLAVLKDKCSYWIIFNEPLVYIYNGFIRGIWPPGIKSAKSALTALKNILKAYSLSYEVIKASYKDKPSYISIAKHMRVFTPCGYFNYGQNNIFAFLRSKLFNFRIIDNLAEKRRLDFLGINYYCREFVKAAPFLGKECRDAHHRDDKNEIGWFIYPQGLYNILMRLKKYNLPVIITENGTPGLNNEQYHDFLSTHLNSAAKALNEGVDLRGYFWWSLLDNFEWDQGFAHKFGLVEVDFSNFTRKVRPFAGEYKKIIEQNSVEI